MVRKPTYEELEQRVKELGKEATERKLAEEALRENVEKHRILLDEASDPIFSFYPDGQYRYVNRAFAVGVGKRVEEIIGKKIWDVFPKDEADKRFAALREVFRTGEDKVMEVRVPRREGDRCYLTTITPIKAGQDRVISVICSSKDITAHKRAERALRESEEKFRILVEKSPLGVSLIGTDGSYKYVNPKFTQIFGYTLDDIPAGRDWFSKAYPDKAYKHQVVSMWKTDFRELKAGEVRPRAFNVICKDGTEKVIRLRPVMTETGDYLVIYEDISEQKRLEAQLQKAQKLEAIGTLAGGIAHDFNNLLMGIQGRTSLMLMDTDGYDSHFEHLKGIEEYVKSAADLTRQLLGFARGGKYEVKPTDLNEVVKKTSEMFGRTKKEIGVHSSYQKEPWTAEVDRGQIEQVLLNLYVNAWQAMPGGGDLYLETQNVTLDEDYVQPHQIAAGRYVKISVTDIGVGMDKKTQERIFDPFFTTKEMGRGTGLGLASTYGIIKNHEGIINVYSVKGQGSTFNIYLHRHDQIDMVVLDMVMPEMGGGAVYDRLKEVNPDIKVLLSSGYSINGQAKEILARGCDGFIQKPYGILDLSLKLREVLDKKK